MGFGRVADVVHAVHDGVEAGVEADRVIGGSDVVVDRSRQSDAVDAHFGELFGPHVGAVPADDDESVNSGFTKVVDGDLANGLFFEFAEPCSAKHRATAVDDVRDR